MKKELLYICCLFLFSYNSFSQDLKCCKTIEEVKKKLSGKWKQVNSESQDIYHYEFEGKLGSLEIYKKPLDSNIVAVIVSCQPVVTVLKNKKGFQLEYTYMLGTDISIIKYLNKNKMTLVEEGIETEYKKLKD
jgi:hypothetical protein